MKPLTNNLNHMLTSVNKLFVAARSQIAYVIISNE